MIAPRRGTARQMVLDLKRAPSYDAEDFLVSPANAAAHALIGRWPDWPARTLLLTGPPGSGKSHLAAIWSHQAQAERVCPETIAAYAAGGVVTCLLEDADQLAYPEPDLFHLLNLAEETAGWLLLTARKPPDQWNVHTPDLLSRLRRAPVAAIAAPDPILIRSVLVKLFADRQIRIDADVVAYAALHGEQSLEAAERFVAAVDEAALAEGRRITRPLAARTLALIGGDVETPEQASPAAACQGPT